VQVWKCSKIIAEEMNSNEIIAFFSHQIAQVAEKQSRFKSLSLRTKSRQINDFPYSQWRSEIFLMQKTGVFVCLRRFFVLFPCLCEKFPLWQKDSLKI
jgi:hypothetical protein